MNKKITPRNDAILCISVASKPGKFGITVHNAGYNALGLNFIYKTFAIHDIEGAIKGVKALGIRGCSVSMPFKEKVIPLLDELDPLAKKTKAVNTVVNKRGRLIGYNTDVLGVQKCIKPLKIKKNKEIIVLGAGGIARAILVALKNLKFKNITISNRTSKRGKILAKDFHTNFVQWSHRKNLNADFIINATSIGMLPNTNLLPISQKNIMRSEVVLDVITSPPNTKLIQFANKHKIISINGLELALHQAYAQFKLYTGRNPPVDIMEKAVKELFKR